MLPIDTSYIVFTDMLTIHNQHHKREREYTASRYYNDASK